MDLANETALSLGRRLRERNIGCVELTRAVLEQIKATEPNLNAYTSILEKWALAKAETVQRRLDGGEALSPLAGVPVAVKDNICTSFAPTTCASKMLEHFTPPYDATAVERLEAAGAVLVGKLNLDEFAMGGSTETSCFGPTRNPWDTGRVPGGSSGGAAAAVAAGSAPFALGSDTGGSIRQPCAFCGVSGIKPTYGAVSRYGLVAFASSLDQIGPVGRTVEDCAAVLSIIAGRDPRDSTSAAGMPDFSTICSGLVENLRIGIPSNYFGDGLYGDVASSVQEAAKTLESLGAKLVPLELPLVDYAVPAYYVAACAEASSNLSRYDGVKYGFRAEGAETVGDLYIRSRSEGFGMEVKRRIMLGSFVLSSGYYDAYYKRALQARRRIQQGFDEAFGRCDLLLAPCAPTTAYRLGERISDPLAMYLGDIYTVSVNLAGLPAVAAPCGFDRQGLPVGMQLIGPAFSEPRLIQAAHVFQQHTGFHLRTPGRGGDPA